MKVYPDQIDEYVDRHNPIWPELEELLLTYGVKNYSIFIDRETAILFACAEVDDVSRWESIAETDVCRRWWEHMAPLMETNEDLSPKAQDLEEIFHIERRLSADT